MRADPADFELLAPQRLPEVLILLAREPGAWLPIAGGTDLMVLYSAGKLSCRKLVSICKLAELRAIEMLPSEIRIGAACTYTELRRSEVVAREFPLLVRAAAWTGSIANQNRGTLGGNIVNASPAADSLPALLVYEAELILASTRGERRVPYVEFHTAYKKMDLAPDELIRAICLPRKYSAYFSYARKVGARNAQAISKVCLSALGLLKGDFVEDVRLALGSVAPVPLRLRRTEELIRGKLIDSGLLGGARKTAIAEIQPIDDIRSVASYRSAVTGNLVAEFLEQLMAKGKLTLTLARWNSLSADAAANEILPCCGSPAWAKALAGRRPIQNEETLLSASNEIWRGLAERDWLEAFRSHPRIGESKAPASARPQSAAWSAQEQASAATSEEAVKAALAEGNRAYERQFGRIFIVCATGKSAAEMLEILRRRLASDEATELREAAEQQRQITQIRLKKWLRA
jgi:OHCU decarboxylase